MKTIEQTYQKKTPLEHILLRPDTYIGSTQTTPSTLHISPNPHEINQKQISYTPALYKIFDEILSNAADNKQRDAGMTTIKATLSPKSVSIYNDGRGIPVVIHKTEQVYVPTLIFGSLLTSSNYDDSTVKVVGGRNGYGAKLANIFSTSFTVETSDGVHSFSQTWKGNMSVAGDVIVKPHSGPQFTKITFKPGIF